MKKLSVILAILFFNTTMAMATNPKPEPLPEPSQSQEQNQHQTQSTNIRTVNTQNLGVSFGGVAPESSSVSGAYSASSSASSSRVNMENVGNSGVEFNYRNEDVREHRSVTYWPIREYPPMASDGVYRRNIEDLLTHIDVIGVPDLKRWVKMNQSQGRPIAVATPNVMNLKEPVNRVILRTTHREYYGRLYPMGGGEVLLRAEENNPLGAMAEFLLAATEQGVDVAQIIGSSQVHTTVASSKSFKVGGDTSVLAQSGTTAVNPVLGGGIGTERAPVSVEEGFLIRFRFFGILPAGKIMEDYLDLGVVEPIADVETFTEQETVKVGLLERIFGKRQSMFTGVQNDK